MEIEINYPVWFESPFLLMFQLPHSLYATLGASDTSTSFVNAFPSASMFLRRKLASSSGKRVRNAVPGFLQHKHAHAHAHVHAQVCVFLSLSLYTHVHILSYTSLLKLHVSKCVVPACKEFELQNVQHLTHGLTQNLECHDKAWILIKPKLKLIGLATG